MKAPVPLQTGPSLFKPQQPASTGDSVARRPGTRLTLGDMKARAAFRAFTFSGLGKPGHRGSLVDRAAHVEKPRS